LIRSERSYVECGKSVPRSDLLGRVGLEDMVLLLAVIGLLAVHELGEEDRLGGADAVVMILAPRSVAAPGESSLATFGTMSGSS
jgi:hypothetical protein